MSPTMQAAPALRRRRHRRLAGFHPCTVEVDRAKMPCHVLNASSGGACLAIQSPSLIPVGSPVTLDWHPAAELGGGAGDRRCVMAGTVVRADKGAGGNWIYGVRFRRLIREHIEQQRARLRKTLVAFTAAALALFVGALKTHNFINFWYDPWLAAYSVGAVLFVFSRILLSFFYEEPPDRGHFPTVSIIIAAKNEEKHIGKTIEHCFASNYPPDLYEVIAVDDGSDDGTWAVMEELRARYPRLKNIRFERNKGKRHGMAAGAHAATGEVLAYVDSDSYIDPDGLYRIVQPFADPSIGAVSGHVLAAIEEDNFISKMEAVRYYVSHRVMKAAESIFGAVTCCPGAFSAYRRSAVMEVVHDWLNQKFLGAEATFGDDRSLTNYILRKRKVIYHAGALCLTYVPRTFRQFFRQQLRWKKSWSRETTVAVRIMWKKNPFAALFYYLGVVLTLISPLIALRAVFLVPLFHSAASAAPYVLGVFLTALFLCLIYLYHTQCRYWYYGLAFAALYLIFFSFQNYYAIATMRKNHWGTR